MNKIERARQYRVKNREKILENLRTWHKEKVSQPPVTAERLRELLNYCPATGEITNRKTRGRFQAGSRAGTRKADGRILVVVDGRLYRAHRLAWLYMTGEWPEFEIDHKDTNPSNNAWENLRDVTSTVNKQNMRVAPRGKKYSPLLGAQWCAQIQRWKSSIRVNGKAVNLGLFASDVEASEAYLAAKRRLHEGCTL